MPETTSGGRAFGHSLFGYRRSSVDAYFADVDAARRGLEAEIERLRAAEPLTRVGDDIAALLTSFAQTVSTLRDRVNEDAERLRQDAEAYAADRRAEADRILEEARRSASVAAGELLNRARAEVASLAGHQLTIAEALDRAAEGITASRQVLAHLVVEAQSGVVVVPESSPPVPQPPVQELQPTWPSAAAG
jgi:cell division septum initiation protein DivIVA